MSALLILGGVLILLGILVVAIFLLGGIVSFAKHSDSSGILIAGMGFTMMIAGALIILGVFGYGIWLARLCGGDLCGRQALPSHRALLARVSRQRVALFRAPALPAEPRRGGVRMHAGGVPDDRRRDARRCSGAGQVAPSIHAPSAPHAVALRGLIWRGVSDCSDFSTPPSPSLFRLSLSLSLY